MMIGRASRRPQRAIGVANSSVGILYYIDNIELDKEKEKRDRRKKWDHLYLIILLDFQVTYPFYWDRRFIRTENTNKNRSQKK